MSEFQVGQKVVHSSGQVGLVIAINDPEFDGYPVTVQFSNGAVEDYTLAGLEFMNRKDGPSIKHVAQETKKEQDMIKFYVGQKVVHSDGRIGTVANVDTTGHYNHPVLVDFNDGAANTFTAHGLEYILEPDGPHIQPVVTSALLKAQLQAYAVLVAANDTNYPRCTLLKKMANDPAFTQAAEELAGKLLFALNAGRTVRRRQKQSHLLFAAAIEILFRNGVRVEQIYGYQTGWGLCL